MRYNELISILQKSFDIKVISGTNSTEIEDIRLLNKGELPLKENVIYVGNWSDTSIQPTKSVLLLCPEKISELPPGSGYSLIQAEDITSLFNKAKDLLFQDIQAGSKFFEIAQRALNGASASTLINIAANLMGNALILVDFSQKVIAHSNNFEIKDPLWAQNVERGYCSYDFVQKVRSSTDMKEWNKQGSETKLITLSGDLQPKLVARVTHEGHVVGAVVMVEHHTIIGSIHFQQLPLIGKMLFDAYFRDSDSLTFPSIHSAILYDLLDELDYSDIKENLTMAKINFPDKMQVVLTRFIHHMQNRYIKHTFGLELKRIFPQGHLVHYKSYIGILVPTINDIQTESLTKLAQNEDISIGISWPFTDISQFRRHFYQAVSSIKQAQHFGQINQVFDYTNYSSYDLLYNYTGKIPLKNYCHPALQSLREYDKLNNTELYNTLRTYLECEKNLRLTSNALFIHRNTLLYRINRITQLTDIDLKNWSLSYCLMESFKIDTFLNESNAMKKVEIT